AYLANEVLAGLNAAHTALDPDTHTPLRVVHRDVSPQNVLVAYSGQVKLADFGVARAEGRRRVTESRTVCGKLGYMPLEQATGSSVDARADLFALGVTLFELLTGLRPFTGDRAKCTRDEVIAAMLLGERPELRALRPDVSPALAALVDAMLVVSPRRRLPSALAGLEMLEAATERTRGGRALIEWLAALYPGQASVAGIARAAIAVPAALPTPRPAPGTHPTARLDHASAQAPRTGRPPVLQLVDEVTRPARVERKAEGARQPVTVRRPRLWVVPPTPSTPPPSVHSGAQTRSVARPSRARVVLVRLAALLCLACVTAAAGALRSPRVARGTARAEMRPRAARRAALPVAAVSVPLLPAVTLPRSPAAAEPAVSRDAAPPLPATAPAHGTARTRERDPVVRGQRASHHVPVAFPWPASALVASAAPPPPPATGSLRVVVVPWGEVEIDGRAYGRAPVTASLPAGTHRVHIGGGFSRTQQVEVRQGQVSVLAFDED
ncbi:MAG: serine/threonine-protein kinase, partial [Deltaproteobacteria bacterium]